MKLDIDAYAHSIITPRRPRCAPHRLDAGAGARRVRAARARAGAAATGTPRAGEDDALYSCKKRTGQVAVTFKPETELKDLITWVMGFTCKNFILDPRIVSTGKKVTVIAPNKMSAAEAYRVFLVALSTMGLTVVPKGNMLRIVESATAKSETVPIYKKGVPGERGPGRPLHPAAAVRADRDDPRRRSTRSGRPPATCRPPARS